MLALIVAAAAAPLVHEGDAEGAVAQASELTGESGWESRPWAEVRSGSPVALGGSEIFSVCAEAPPLAEGLDALRGAVLYADPDVDARRKAAEIAAACEGATPEQLGRMGFLAGVAAADADQADTARGWFRAARTWNPEQAFDSDFPSKLKPLFDDAVPAEDRFSVTTFPAATTINGGPPDPVPAGPHLVRTNDTGFWIRTGEFAETVVWPDAVDDDILTRLDDEAERRVLSTVLSAQLGEGQRVGVATDTAIWVGTTGRTDWKRFEIPVAPAPVPDPLPDPTLSPKKRNIALPAVVTGIGAIAMGTGAALASSAWQARPHDDLDSHNAGRSRYWTGWGVVGAGALASGAGLTMLVVL